MWKLEYYLAKFSYLAMQGSQDWLEGKSISFGGSEMSCILDKSKHEKWKSLKTKKISKIYEHCDITEWGHLFEVVSKIIITKEHGTIYEFGSIPHPYYPVCYSPDGVLIKDDDLVLLEIKNPVMNGIHKEIKQEYLDQVYTGMEIINVKHCLFARFRFRRCLLGTDPNNCVYDRFFHKEWRKRQKDAFPISYGYLHWKVDCELIDLSNVENMCTFIYKYNVKPTIYIEQIPEFLCNEKSTEKKGLILMWKLFEYKYDIIQPKRDYLKENEKKIWKRYKDLYYSKKLNNLSKKLKEEIRNTQVKQKDTKN